MGLIIGLSVSPVVKSILGTLAGLLGVFLGLQENIFGKGKPLADARSPIVLSSLRAGSFGLSCTIAILIGLYIRTNDSIGLTPKDQVQKWVQAGYPDSVALEIALVEKMGMTSRQLLSLHQQRAEPINKPEKSTSAKSDTKKDKEEEANVSSTGNRFAGVASSVLFSKEDIMSLSTILDPKEYDNDPAKTLEQYRQWDNKNLTRYANLVSEQIANPSDQLAILRLVSDLTIVVISYEKQFEEIYKAMQKMETALQWAEKENISTMLELLAKIKKSVPSQKRDEMVRTIAVLVFKTKL